HLTCPIASHIRPTTRSTLFPYTTLFRSISEHGAPTEHVPAILESPVDNKYRKSRSKARLKQREDIILSTDQLFSTILKADNQTRSEEHTSELQSRENLVCRLLLEKKKKK